MKCYSVTKYRENYKKKRTFSKINVTLSVLGCNKFPKKCNTNQENVTPNL